MGEPWGLNPYSYVKQSPTMYWDPNGQAEQLTPALTFAKSSIESFSQNYKEAASQGKQCMGTFVAGMKGLFGDTGFQTHKTDKVIADVLPRLGDSGKTVEHGVSFGVTKVDEMGTVAFRGRDSPSEAILNAIGQEKGWSVFALSIGGGYHVASVVVDTTKSAPVFYWFDQTARGQVSGARVNEKILHFTQQVVDKREPVGKGYDLRLGITRVVPSEKVDNAR